MSIDAQWLNELRGISDLATRDTLVVNNVEITLPLKSARGKQRPRDWQRRILPDLIADSVNADAPERTPFRLLYGLTSGQKTEVTIGQAMQDGLAPLEDAFRMETRGRKRMTLAFHVLAVKAAEKGEHSAKGYTERTILLLCRRPDGTLNDELLRALVEQFRRAPEDLDLAQRTILRKLHPGWTPESEPTFDLPDSARVQDVPFDPVAARLFQEDIRSLLNANIPSSDFFHQLNLLFTVHLGLYQPRLAALLNPQMELMQQEFAAGDPRNLQDLRALVARFRQSHPFRGSLNCRAPDPELRKVTLHTPSRRSFDDTGALLAVFHFNVLLLVRLRRLGEAYLTTRWGHHDAWKRGDLDLDITTSLVEQLKGPEEFMARMDDDPDFRVFLDRAVLALAVRFVQNQIAETSQETAYADISKAQSSLHALRVVYERYNRESSKNPTSSRAHKQGIQLTSSLLQHNQYGLVQSRQRVGSFYELGAGLLPLLILLAVGPGNEKVPVRAFWDRLADYGLAFDADERERVLERLRSMGVFERYSDAGEAAFVRNLITSRAA